MSFFDEDEETRVRPPAAEPRRRSRSGGSRPPGGGSRPPARGRQPTRGGGRRPPTNEQAIRVRQGLAIGALLIVVILIVVGVHSCTVSASNSALRSYSDSVNSLIRSSNQTGQQFFRLLSGASGSSDPATLQSKVEATRAAAASQLQTAQGLNAPSQVTEAQQYLVSTMRLRRDGISNVASQLQPALQSSASSATAAVNEIATEMARLYASDVLYKDYTLPMTEAALQNAGISGQPLDTDQFVPNLQWLSPSFVAAELHATTVPSGSSKAPPPGTPVGHELDSCSVGGVTLSTVGATSLPAGSAPQLACTVTNDGQVTETSVVVKASIQGTSVTGQGTIPQTQPGQQYNVSIPLGSAPPAGTYSLNVTVERVPGEVTVTHNTKVFPVTFG